MKYPLIATIASIVAELDRAVDKFPLWPTDPIHAANIVGEEFGELQKAILEHTYEPEKATLQDIRTEALQTAAMAIRFIRSLDEYVYKPSEQHKQML